MTHRHQLLIERSKCGLNVYDLALSADISHGAFHLWHLILKFRDKNTGVAWACPDVKTLCSILNCTLESFGRWRKELEAALLLRVENMGGPTRKRWQYTILDGAGKTAHELRSTSSGWDDRWSAKAFRRTAQDQQNPWSVKAHHDSRQMPTMTVCKSRPHLILLTERMAALRPPFLTFRACERRQENKADDPPPSEDKEKPQNTGVDPFEALRIAM